MYFIGYGAQTRAEITSMIKGITLCASTSSPSKDISKDFCILKNQILHSVVLTILFTLSLKYDMIEDFQETADGFIIHYNGECISTRSRHSTNRTFVTVTPTILMVSCYDSKCKRPYLTDTPRLFAEEVYDLCFRSDKLVKNRIKQYLNSVIDPGISALKSEKGILTAQSTDLLLPK